MKPDTPRLRFEQKQLRNLFGGRIPLVRFTNVDAWESFGVQFPLNGSLVQGHFAPDPSALAPALSGPPGASVAPLLRGQEGLAPVLPAPE